MRTDNVCVFSSIKTNNNLSWQSKIIWSPAGSRSSGFEVYCIISQVQTDSYRRLIILPFFLYSSNISYLFIYLYDCLF